MPWNKCSVMDERLQFVASRWLNIAGSSAFPQDRLQGFDRYQECGVPGLTDRSRRPIGYANQLPFQVQNRILNVKREHGSWGARKIPARLLRRFSGSRSRPRTPSMRCWTAMAWWSTAAGPLYFGATVPMSSGSPITRGSSCWAAIDTIATP